jgi:hypothetical protein
MPVRVLLAGPDTLYFSCDLPISEAMRDRLNEDKAIAQALADERRVHCPEWLGARVCPQGAKGGYAFLIETEDFSVKLLGERIQNRPRVYLEMRSYALVCARMRSIPIPKGHKAPVAQRWRGCVRSCTPTSPPNW